MRSRDGLLPAFQQPNSALIICGVDSLTTDIGRFFNFLDSSYRYEVELFWIENGDLRVQASSSTLQNMLREWVASPSASSPSTAQSSAPSPQPFDPGLSMASLPQFISLLPD
jgi:hypothetical protein